jgi:hypothetical protein
MSQKIIVAGFAVADDLLAAVRAVRKSGWDVADIYMPYAVHGLEEELGWRRSRLSAACFLGGAAGVALAVWFQFWTSAQNWPLNVGGRPWNSLPAFVPVIFETMVLLAGITLVLAWLFRSGLYPGRAARLAMSGVTDDRFALAVRDPGPASAQACQLLRDLHATSVEERTEEEPQ